MLLEALVITACLNQKGCDQSTDAYYKQSVELQEMNRNLERVGKRIVKNNQWIVWAASPIYMIASGQEAKINIGHGLFLTLNRTTRGAGLQWFF